MPPVSHTIPAEFATIRPTSADWRATVTWFIAQVRTQAQAAAMLGTNTQALYRWTKLDLPETPDMQDALDCIRHLRRRDAVLATEFLGRLLGPLLQIEQPQTVEQYMARIRRDLDAIETIERYR